MLVFAMIPAASAQHTPPPATNPPSSRGQQQPGANTQIQERITSELAIDAHLQNLLADHQYAQAEAQLSQLAPEHAQFYRGILANRSNDLDESVKLLQPLVDAISLSGNLAQEKLVRKALAEDYLRLGEWNKAAEVYQMFDARLTGKLTPDEQDEIEMPLKMLPLAKDSPPTTVEPCDSFKLNVSEDPLGLIDIPVFVDAFSRNWMLDPTLPFNLIARSTAKDADLKISEASATITTLTGRPMQVRAAVISRFTIGGRLTIHDMTAFVYDDKDYYFPQTSYQVEGVLGYPALAAMGSLTVTSDNTILVRPAKQIASPEPADKLTDGARFYLDGDQIVVALGRRERPAVNSDADGKSTTPAPSKDIASDLVGSPGNSIDEHMYAVDPGGQQTYLTSRYFAEHAAEFNGQKTELFSLLGSQSAQSAYVAESVHLQTGSTTVALRDIYVLTQPIGTAALDDVYGVIGADALSQLQSYTFDYRTMRFAATAEP
jgi:hypothetical protein